MQTFFTDLDLNKSSYSLWEGGRWPGNRLFSQINEGLVILRTLTGWYLQQGRKGWPHHAAVKMWAGYEPYLAHYVITHIDTYQRLSGKNCSHRVDQVIEALACNRDMLQAWVAGEYEKPGWLTEEFCSVHRSVLLSKVHLAKDVAFQKYYNTIGEDDNPGLERKFQKAVEVLEWYQSFNWSEQPAQKVMIDGKMRWPYLWPEVA